MGNSERADATMVKKEDRGRQPTVPEKMAMFQLGEQVLALGTTVLHRTRELFLEAEWEGGGSFQHEPRGRFPGTGGDRKKECEQEKGKTPNVEIVPNTR